MSAPFSARSWPTNRRFPRYKLDVEAHLISDDHGLVRGWCRDIGEGGLGGTFPAALKLGDLVRVRLQLPGDQHTLLLQARLRHANGFRYGFAFDRISDQQRAALLRFTRKQTTVAFMLCSDPDVSRELQRLLQQIGVAQVTMGCPKVSPVPFPHLVIVDSDWPDYLDVIRFLRADAGDERIVIVGLMPIEMPVGEINSAGADLVLRKPISVAWAQRILGTAYKLLRRDAVPPAPKPPDDVLMRLLHAKP